MQLTTSSGAIALRVMISRMSSSVAARIARGIVALDGRGAAQGEEAHRRAIMPAMLAEPAPGPSSWRDADADQLADATTLVAAGRRAQRSTSAGRNRRCAPSGRSPSASGPKARGASARTGCPTASHIRRTWRLRPSWIVELELVRAEPAHPAGRRAPVLELDAVAQRAQRPLARPAPPATSAR